MQGYHLWWLRYTRFNERCGANHKNHDYKELTVVSANSWNLTPPFWCQNPISPFKSVGFDKIHFLKVNDCLLKRRMDNDRAI